MGPEFRLIVGPMFSGKTSSLINHVVTRRLQGDVVVVLKPKLDDRYGDNAVVTHDGKSIEASLVSRGSDILNVLLDRDDEPDVVALDEAFMVDDVADVLVDLFRSGKSVIVASIDMSSSCVPFDEIQRMFSWATDVEKRTASCSCCSAPARYTHRKDDVSGDSRSVVVGGEDLYEPRCGLCHTSAFHET